MYDHRKISQYIGEFKAFDGELNFRFGVMLLISSARIKPRIVTAKAINFQIVGYCYLGDSCWRNIVGNNESSKKASDYQTFDGVCQKGITFIDNY